MAHIQIDSTTPRIAYTATAAQDEFTVPFAFFVDADLTVYVDDVLQTLDTDYTVSGAGDSEGGSITFATPLDGGESVVIVRDVAISRTTDFPTTGPLQINSLNTQLDKLIAIDQQLQNDIARSLRLADSDSAEDFEVPIASERANKFLAFDADGNPFVAEAVEDQPASNFGLTLIDDTTRQAALVTLGVLAGRRTLTGAGTAIASDHGGIIEATSGTFSLAFTEAATLGLGFWCFVYNSGTGTVTLDPDGAELIDGGATIALATGQSVLVFCTGSAFETIGHSNVAGPSSATDGHAVLFNGTSGKLIKTAGAAPYIVGGTDVPITDGGTGASTAAAARTALDIAAAPGAISGAAISGGAATVTVALGTYDLVEIDLICLEPSDDGVDLFCRFSQDAGLNYLAGASDYAWALVRAGAAVVDNADSEIALTGGVGNSTNERATITVRVFRPAASSFAKTMTWHGGYFAASTSDHTETSGWGQLLLNANAVTHVQFLFSAGTFDAGFVAARGYRFS